MKLIVEILCVVMLLSASFVFVFGFCVDVFRGVRSRLAELRAEDDLQRRRLAIARFEEQARQVEIEDDEATELYQSLLIEPESRMHRALRGLRSPLDPRCN